MVGNSGAMCFRLVFSSDFSSFFPYTRGFPVLVFFFVSVLVKKRAGKRKKSETEERWKREQWKQRD